MSEDGSFNPSNCSLRHLNTEGRDGAISLKDHGKKNEQRLQNERTKHGPSHIPEQAVDITDDPGIAGGQPRLSAVISVLNKLKSSARWDTPGGTEEDEFGP